MGVWTTKKIMKELEGRIYKDDSPEVRRVKNIVDKLVDKNGLRRYWRGDKIKVVHLPTIG